MKKAHQPRFDIERRIEAQVFNCLANLRDDCDISHIDMLPDANAWDTVERELKKLTLAAYLRNHI